MIGRYLVLINGKPADIHNYPSHKPTIKDSAIFFWKNSARKYQSSLRANLGIGSPVVELRKI